MELEMWRCGRRVEMCSPSVYRRPGVTTSGSGDTEPRSPAGSAIRGQTSVLLVAYEDDIVRLTTNENACWAWIKQVDDSSRQGDPEVVLG
jgi:hypothetical protein